MSNQNNTPEFDVKTTDNGSTLFGLGGKDWHTHTVEIRDNSTGKTYSSTNYDESKARDDAWEQANNDKRS